MHIDFGISKYDINCLRVHNIYRLDINKNADTNGNENVNYWIYWRCKHIKINGQICKLLKKINELRGREWMGRNVTK